MSGKQREATDEFEGRTAIVTGAGTGLGETIAERLVAGGANVVLANRSVESAREVAARIDRDGGRTLVTETDVRDPDSVRQMVEAAVDRFGGLHYFAIIEAPSVLGLFPKGVEVLPDALLAAGLAERLDARRAGRVESPPYDDRRDAETLLLNPRGIADYSVTLADATGDVIDAGEFAVVLGRDCSIVLGCLLALRRRGRHGLLFLDGHADFYQPEAEPNGEAASMDLALVTGRGPAVVADLEGRRPLVRDEDVVVLGRRDAEDAEEHGSRRIEETADPNAAGRQLWAIVAADLSVAERRTLQLTMLPVSLVHDEYQFIRVLQAYEATFALVAVELHAAVRALSAGESGRAVQRIRAAETVLRESAPLFSLVGTMQVEAFRAFRVFTEGASAIQSRNYKLVESVCRQPDPDRLESIAYLSVPEVRERGLAGHATLDEAFASARADGQLDARDIDDLEEAMRRFATTLRRWRRTHVRLAVRMLGERSGTGYTEGTPYLQAVQAIPVFSSLAVREQADGPGDEAGNEIAPRCPWSGLQSVLRPAGAVRS